MRCRETNTNTLRIRLNIMGRRDQFISNNTRSNNVTGKKRKLEDAFPGISNGEYIDNPVTLVYTHPINKAYNLSS